MSDPKDNIEQQLEEYLAGQSELSSVYAKAPTETVSEKISKDIRQMAVQELEKNEKSSGWYVPLSLAAAIALSVTVYLLVKNQPVVDPTEQIAKQEQTDLIKEKQIAVDATDSKQKELQVVQQKQQTVPDNLQDLLQSTSRRGEKANEEYPSSAELAGWKPERWAKTVWQLEKDQNMLLADRYRKDFVKYHPKVDLQELIDRLH